MDPQEQSQRAIDAFCDALWLEDGLSPNTLLAYRRDLSLYAQWLREHGRSLLNAKEAELNGYFAARHGQSRPSSVNRRLTVLRRFYQMALRHHQIDEDPTRHIHSAKQSARFPKVLSEEQIVSLLQARVGTGGS